MTDSRAPVFSGGRLIYFTDRSGAVRFLRLSVKAGKGGIFNLWRESAENR